MTLVLAEYLAAARAMGVERAVRGHRCVACLSTDPVTNETFWFVEYAPVHVLADGSLVALLLDELCHERPTGTVLLRSPAVSRPPPGWRPFVTYIAANGAALKSTSPDEVEVRAAGDPDLELVRPWIERALADGYRARGRTAAASRIKVAAEGILASPGRQTFVGLVRSLPVGHITLEPGVIDAVTGRVLCEVVDILVEEGPSARRVRRALVSAAVDCAEAAGQPLVGNVIHDVARPHDYPGPVLAQLMSAGWVPDYCVWARSMAAAAPASVIALPS